MLKRAAGKVQNYFTEVTNNAFIIRSTMFSTIDFPPNKLNVKPFSHLSTFQQLYNKYQVIKIKELYLYSDCRRRV